MVAAIKIVAQQQYSEIYILFERCCRAHYTNVQHNMVIADCWRFIDMNQCSCFK